MKAKMNILAMLAFMALVTTSCGIFDEPSYNDVVMYGSPYYYEGTTYYYYNNVYYLPYDSYGTMSVRRANNLPRSAYRNGYNSGYDSGYDQGYRDANRDNRKTHYSSGNGRRPGDGNNANPGNYNRNNNNKNNGNYGGGKRPNGNNSNGNYNRNNNNKNNGNYGGGNRPNRDFGGNSGNGITSRKQTSTATKVAPNTGRATLSTTPTQTMPAQKATTTKSHSNGNSGSVDVSGGRR